MKKYTVCFIVVALILICSVVSPDIMYASSPRVVCVSPTRKTVTRTVTVTGKIASDNEQTQFSDDIYVIEKVLVSPGDYITEGENVFSVDLKKTAELYLAQGKTYSGGEFLCSSVSGTVNQIAVADGMAIKEASVIFTAIDTDSLCAKLSVGEDVFSYIKAGQSVSITGNAFKGRTYKGTISQIGAVASADLSAVTTVPVKVDITEPDTKLKSGFSVKAKITVKTIKNALVLPSECISSDEQGDFVYIFSDSVAQKRYVKCGIITKNGTVISKNLTEQDKVIQAPESIEKDNETVVSGETR